MQQDIQIMKQKCNAGMIDLCLAKFGEVKSTHPWESSVSCDPPTKIQRAEFICFLIVLQVGQEHQIL